MITGTVQFLDLKRRRGAAFECWDYHGAVRATCEAAVPTTMSIRSRIESTCR